MPSLTMAAAIEYLQAKQRYPGNENLLVKVDYGSGHDQLLAAIALCQYAVDRAIQSAPDAAWEQTYDAVFECYNDVIKPLTAMLGLRHEWCDPDMNYDDVKAFVESLTDLKERHLAQKQLLCR